MKKNITRFFSALTIAATVFSASAAGPQVAQKLGGGTQKRAVAQKVEAKPATTFKGIQPATKHPFSNPVSNKLRSASKNAFTLKQKANVPTKEAGNLPDMLGLVTFAENWTQEDNALGLYQLPKANGQDFSLVASYATGYAGFLQDGVYYTSAYEDYGFFAFVVLGAYDTATGEAIGEGDGQLDQVFIDCATDPTTGTIYSLGYTADGQALQLAKVTPSNDGGLVSFAVEPITVFDDFNWNSIACDATGQLYGVTREPSTLCKIDKTTGAVTTVGETGVTPQYLSSSEIDPKSGRMFWTVCTETEGYLAEINLQTGAATKLLDFLNREEVQGLVIPAPAAEDKAPAAVTDLTISFPEGTLTGTVNFTAPTTLFDGTAATGALTYEVLVDGTSAATGDTSFGASVSAPVTVAASGKHVFVVTVSNEVGASPKEKATMFIGKGIPEAPKATLEYAAGKMNLTWTAVTTSADGGYINPDEVTYTVTRFPGETVVLTDSKETSFSEDIVEPAELTSYYYTVVAKYADAVSEAAQSNNIVLGAIVPPYEQTFDGPDGLEGFTLIDANDDGKKWSLYMDSDGNGTARMAYNSSLAMDDWLITPPLKLEGGKVYLLTFDTFANGTSFPERIEAKMGNSNTVEAMTETLLEPTVLTSKDPLKVAQYLAPKTTGTYYIGFHGISDADQFYLYVDNVKIGAATSADAPGEATNLSVVSDPNGELKATVSFNAPSTTLGGGTLSSLTKVELSRDGELINTFSSPAVGAALSFVDTPAENGNHTYTVVGYNNEGQGKSVSITGFVGVDAPAAPETATIVETENEGEVTVSWSAVSTDQNGNPINPSLVTYTIAQRGESAWEPLFEGITGTSYTFRAIEEGGEQDFAQFAVFAVTSGGNNGIATDMIPVGPAYEGMIESFPDGIPSHILGISTPQGSNAQWNLFDDEYFSGEVTSQDGDNGFIGMRGQNIEDAGSLFTGKVSLAGMVAPSFSFYTYNIVGENGEEDTNTIEVSVKELGGEYTSVFNKTVVEICGTDVWGKATIDLSAYAGKTIQVQITTTVQGFAYIFLDNLKIASTVDNDLKAGAITAPAKVQAGATYPVDVTVSNEGSKDAAAFTVDLFANGEKVDTKTVDALASGARTHAVFECTMHALATEPVELYAVVNAAADDVADNNTTKTITVTPKVSTLPAPAELKAETAANGGVQLTWSEPNLDGGVGEEVTEGFEEGEAGFEFGDWTFVDADQSPIGGFQGTDIPGITPGQTTAAFFVFDTSLPQFQGQYAQSYAAHSGDKFLAAMFRYDDDQVDDWAISPVLDGSAQTISFYAKSYSAQYPEKIEILYSTGSVNPEDFVSVKPAEIVPNEWTPYEAELPAGALHFAIRSCATGSFMLMIDDVTYTSGSQTADLSLMGYNVYRDGVKLNAEPVEESAHLDLEGLAHHKYQVTALYDGRGESTGSNEASVTQGIADITDGLSITTDKGLILVSGADDKLVTVTSVDGRVLYSAKGDASVSVATGIYVVKAGKTVAKVLVK